MRKRSFLLAAGACAAALSLLGSVALADPANPPGPRLLPGVGSDTTQDVMNGYGNGVTFSSPAFPGIMSGGAKTVASYDATPALGPITTRAAGCTNLPRPNGSTAGVDALAGLNAAFPNTCVDFARSSANTAAARAGQNLTFIPFAIDAVTYATLSQSNVPKNLSQLQLRQIYQRPGPNCGTLQPIIPQAGSGTRSFWIGLFGPLGSCVSDPGVQEHDGTIIVNANQLVPYGVAQWITQTTQPAIADRHGNTVLRAIDGRSPIEINLDFPLTRQVFNVLRTGDVGNPAKPELNQAFVGAGSDICTHPEVLNAYGLRPIPAGNPNPCGSTLIQTPPN